MDIMAFVCVGTITRFGHRLLIFGFELQGANTWKECVDTCAMYGASLWCRHNVCGALFRF